MVADAAKTAAAQAGDTIEAGVERIRELNEQAIQAARTAGQNALDAYQAALESVVDAEQKLAQGSQLDWFSTLVNTWSTPGQHPGRVHPAAGRHLRDRSPRATAVTIPAITATARPTNASASTANSTRRWAGMPCARG